MSRSLFDILMGNHPPEEPKKTESWFGLGGKSNKPIVELSSKERRNLAKLNRAAGKNLFVSESNGRRFAVEHKGMSRREIPLDGGPGFERALIDYNDGQGPR